MEELGAADGGLQAGAEEAVLVEAEEGGARVRGKEAREETGDGAAGDWDAAEGAGISSLLFFDLIPKS